MRLFYRLWAILRVAGSRLLSQRWLAAALAVGLITAVAFVVSIPMYADAVYYRTLVDKLSTRYETRIMGGPASAAARARQRPPFAFTFRYTGELFGALDLDSVRAVDAYFRERAAADLGLPQELLVRHFRSENLRLFPGELSNYTESDRPLAPVKLAFADDLASHIELLEGRLPQASGNVGDTVEVLVGEPLAVELGLQVGEQYTALPRQLSAEQVVTPIAIRIAGVWRATDPTDAYWFYDPTALEELFMVPETSFQRIGLQINREVQLGVWYLVVDGSEIHAGEVPDLIERITRIRQRVNGFLPNTELDESLVDALAAYEQATSVLTVSLYAYSIPVILLLLGFVVLVADLSVSRQRNSIAMLRSRGATLPQVVGIAAVEGLLLGSVALAVGTPAGSVIARYIGRAYSFLTFTLRPSLRVQITAETLGIGTGAVLLTLLAQMLPTASASRHTIVTYKQELARNVRAPWWQRAGLDLLLFIPAGYGAYSLQQQGTIVLPGTDGAPVGDPFQNPLLFLVPALSLLALGLLTVRILPKAMAAAGWLTSHTGSVGFLMAARHLSRTPGFYVTPLLLLVITLSLSIFTASLAGTLDQHLHDRVYYEVGADLHLVELGESTEGGSASTGLMTAPGGGSEGARWLFLPVSEHLKVPDVAAAARVGRYGAITRLGSQMQVGTFIGVDRLDFPSVAFWRPDFASRSLGALMNELAAHPNGVLAPRGFMARHALQEGDLLLITVDTYAQQNEFMVAIVGTFDLFPTWYPQDNKGNIAPLFVGNLDYLYEQAGGQYPYDVWVRTAPNADFESIVKGIRQMQVRVEEWDAPAVKIAEAHQQPERQGLFGLLSVGFLATALLTVLGFLLYALFSFRQRLIELGVMRAIGLSTHQMVGFLGWELALLIGTGGVVGTALGVGTSKFMIPYLQVGTEATAQIPPFIVGTPWVAITQILLLFGLLFLVALAGLTISLLRMQIFRAIKLGETA